MLLGFQKKYLRLTAILLVLSNVVQAGYPRSHGRYDGSLPNVEEVGYGILIAAIFIGLGYLFIYARKGAKEGDSNSILDWGGCLIPIGIIFLLPLLLWVSAIGNALLAVLVVGVVVYYIAVLIWSSIKRPRK